MEVSAKRVSAFKLLCLFPIQSVLRRRFFVAALSTYAISTACQKDTSHVASREVEPAMLVNWECSLPLCFPWVGCEGFGLRTRYQKGRGAPDVLAGYVCT